jgi:hypothetical protein
MHLETAQDIEHDNVTEAQLREAFRNDTGRGDYIILSRGDKNFMQASSDATGFDIEYREGDDHFRVDGPHTKTRVEQAFLYYLNNDERWRTEFPWKKEEIKPWWKFW